MKKNYFLIILVVTGFFVLLAFIFFHSNKNNKTVKDAHKMVIIGSGPAGLSAAIYAARAKLDPIIIQGEYPGGQLNKASQIENWPGTMKIFGPHLAKDIKNQALELGAKLIPTTATKIDFNKTPFTIWTSDNNEIKAQTVIICTGTKPKKLNCPGEEQYLGKGVAVCATCDAPAFKDKKVIVIGGNYSALREIDIIAKYTNNITVINKESSLSGPLSLKHRVTDNPNVKILNNCVANEILGDGSSVNSVKYFNKNTNKVETLPADGIFVCIGWEPSTEIFENHLALDNKKRIKVHDNTKTSVKGIFAAGDVTTNFYHQANVASAFGYMAGMDAENYLTNTY